MPGGADAAQPCVGSGAAQRRGAAAQARVELPGHLAETQEDAADKALTDVCKAEVAKLPKMPLEELKKEK